MHILSVINSWVWGPPTLILLVGTGVYLTVLMRGLQFRKLPRALYLAFVVRKEPGGEGDVSHFQALMTALAATVGTGNIAGVATAIALGGPGALFWMWVTGLVGMATKYTEAFLGVKYRRKRPDGSMSGGPMYYISEGLGLKWLGTLFALFAAVAAFGIGNMVQANSVADALHTSFGVSHWLTGIVLLVGTALVVIGGVKSIARAASVLVPVMVVLYMLGGIIVLIRYAGEIPRALALVITDAFTGTAAKGGFAGASVMFAIRWGVARGVFSNESGLGSAAIAAAAAQTKSPTIQALVSMTQTFLDTLIVCSVTGLVIIVTGAWTIETPAGQGLTGAPLTSEAFSMGLPGAWGSLIVTLGLVLFSYSTLLGWSYYGEKAFDYLFGSRTIFLYRSLFCGCILLGAVTQLSLVWNIADITNGLMALPNLIGLVLLSRMVQRESEG